MFDAGVSGRIIRQQTGNRSIEGICIYKQQFLLVASTTTASTKPLAASCILTPPHSIATTDHAASNYNPEESYRPVCVKASFNT